MLKKSSQTKKQFINEVATIGSIHHQNLVGMLGYCFETDTHALVYEFVENGSLDNYIYDNRKENEAEDRKWLSYNRLYTIGLEAANGILYLHNGCNQKILHCDIKPSNILLDSNFSVKIADFGLARIIDKDHSHVTISRAQGTPGYSAPEMWLRTYGPVTDKSDVYSYGMLLLEMVGRRKNYDARVSDSSQVYYPEWIYNQIEKIGFPLETTESDGDDILEVELDGESIYEEDDTFFQKMCLVGLWCIQHNPANRPSMSKVVQMLEGIVEIGMPPHPFQSTS
ncbi:non-specific serine/threonine protein kinase [Ranunculus cassubicifolius]